VAQDVEYRPWPAFLRRFGEEWAPGQHITAVAPTGEGKTTIFVGLLTLRRYALALDVKGGDETLAGLGWPRLPYWPGKRRFLSMVRKNDEHGRPSRYVVGVPVLDSDELLVRHRASLARCLHDVYEIGHLTVFVDELQVLCDRRQLNLSGYAAKLLVSARSRGISFLSAAQGDSWIIGEAKTQPSWLVIGHTMNRDMQSELGKMTGRSVAKMRGLIDELPDHFWAIAGRRARGPIVITNPPYVRPRTAKAS
jgi:hypothetical protein